MPILTKFLRHVPGPQLRDYFEAKAIPVPGDLDWMMGNAKLLKPLLAVVEVLDPLQQEQIRVEAERIDGMAGEVGQTALLGIANEAQQAILLDIDSGHGRSQWMLLNDPQRFRLAEGASFFENHRRGRTWEAFVAPAGLQVSRDLGRFQDMLRELKEIYRDGGKVKVEVFDRSRFDADEIRHELIQVNVYHEGAPTSPLVFNPDDDIEPLIHRPVVELCFTYEPESGVIEVVAKSKSRRTDLVRIFARTLLGHSMDADRVPVRRYDLSVIMEERLFATDPEDGVAAVAVRWVKLATVDGRACVTIEARTDDETVHAVARRLFGERDPFGGGYVIKEAMMAVRFHGDRFNPQGLTVPIKLTAPNGCNLKEKTGKQRILGEKYLRRWGILEDLDI